MHRRIRALLGGLAIIMVAFALLAAWRWTRRQCWGGDVTCDGILVDGVALPSGVSPEHFIAERARALSLRTLEIAVRDGRSSGARSACKRWGASRRSALGRAFARVGHRGSLAERVTAARAARAGRIDLPLLVAADAEAAFSALDPLKDEVDELPVPARLDIVRHGDSRAPGRFSTSTPRWRPSAPRSRKGSRNWSSCAPRCGLRFPGGRGRSVRVARESPRDARCRPGPGPGAHRPRLSTVRARRRGPRHQQPPAAAPEWDEAGAGRGTAVTRSARLPHHSRRAQSSTRARFVRRTPALAR